MRERNRNQEECTDCSAGIRGSAETARHLCNRGKPATDLAVRIARGQPIDRHPVDGGPVEPLLRLIFQSAFGTGR